jgi:hypothetical protein
MSPAQVSLNSQFHPILGEQMLKDDHRTKELSSGHFEKLTELGAGSFGNVLLVRMKRN